MSDLIEGGLGFTGTRKAFAQALAAIAERASAEGHLYMNVVCDQFLYGVAKVLLEEKFGEENLVAGCDMAIGIIKRNLQKDEALIDVLIEEQHKS